MRGGYRVVWLHRRPVYHRAVYRAVLCVGRAGCGIRECLSFIDRVPCGVIVHHPRLFRAAEETEATARSWGLRRCQRCFRDPV